MKDLIVNTNRQNDWTRNQTQASDVTTVEMSKTELNDLNLEATG